MCLIIKAKTLTGKTITLEIETSDTNYTENVLENKLGKIYNYVVCSCYHFFSIIKSHRHKSLLLYPVYRI